MDSFAVELDRELPVGTPVVLIGHGVLAEEHARVAGTINYELVCGISSIAAARAADGRRWLTIASPVPRDRVAAQQDARAAELAERVRAFVLPQGDERALDVGTGAGALALALAPLVARGRRRRPRARAARARARARGRAATSSSSRETRLRFRSRTARSTSRRRCGRCITSRGPSSCSPSSPA